MSRNIKIDVKIMATPKRTKYLEGMLRSLDMNEDIIVFDDRPNGGGALYNSKRCWLAPMDDDVTHRLVLQDDLELCDNFMEILTTAVSNFPNAMWSLYSSRITENDREFKDSPYIKKRGSGFHGQAILMPRQFIVPCFDFIKDNLPEDYPHDDCAIGYFASSYNMDVMTTIPSLVQHLAPNDSAIGYNNKNKISKVWQGHYVLDFNWNTKKFSTTKRIIKNNLYLTGDKNGSKQ